jgi:outer membrane receptor protein involved in Fe transport
MLWRQTDSLSLKLSALYQKLQGDGSYDVDVPTVGYPSTVNLRDLQQNYLPKLGDYERQIQLYSAVLNAKFGMVDVTSVTGYSSNKYFNTFDYTYSLSSLFQSKFGAGGAAVINNGETDKFSQEVRAVIPLRDWMQWLIGGFYTHEKTLLTQDLPVLDPVTGATLLTAQHSPFNRPYTEYAAFTDLTFDITDRFDVQLGGRQSHIELIYRQSVATGPLLTSGSSVTPELRSSGNAFTYLATPRFKVTPDLMVYARFASGYRPGGPNNVGSPSSPLYDPTTPHQYNPDKTRDYEIGTKTDFLDHRLSLDASIYYVDWSGIQISLTSPISHTNYTSNAGNAKSQGAELALQAHPLAGFTLDAWVAWNDAELTQNFPKSSAAYGIDGDRLPVLSGARRLMLVIDSAPSRRRLSDLPIPPTPNSIYALAYGMSFGAPMLMSKTWQTAAVCWAADLATSRLTHSCTSSRAPSV